MTDDARLSDRGRSLLRRIVWCFAVIVLTLPAVALGGAWALVLVLDLAVAAVAFASAMQLRALRGSARP